MVMTLERLWATTRDPHLLVELESMGLGISLHTVASAGYLAGRWGLLPDLHHKMTYKLDPPG